ncbi:DNA gyrase inhibitor YacG [Azohydromonas sediminis]|uniref:DNA gyrase inhibitor YacG n=1 Tax=Azohydromonas sediminis TaxID=2259674 RepID=UPI000E657E25|nr:DNA gyrase inhibitor YacG [Azohydromonas sediminis]
MSTSPPSVPRRRVRCPACGGPAWYDADNPWRPFCSERCRTHDLGAWASESYRVDAAPDDAEAGLDDTTDPPAPRAAH